MRTVRAPLVILAIATALLAMPRVAAAHPMGNFSINHYTKILPGARTIELEYIIDMAEIPTFQEIQQNQLVTSIEHPSVAPYLARQADRLRSGLELDANGSPLSLEIISRQIIFPPGAGGLPTMKMGFLYRAYLASRIGSAPISIDYRDRNFPGRAGWKEIIAEPGPGAAIIESSVPTRDRSHQLTNYPTDMLNSPPQTLEATAAFKAMPAAMLAESAAHAAGAILQANSQGTPRSAFTELINSQRGDVLFLMMAAVIAAVLGGFHALEPGHGKTLVAAYLVGSRGTARHAVMLGAVVTGSHTISVYVLGIITLYASQWIVPEQLYPWLGTASGLLVAGLGFALFMRRYLSIDPDARHGHRHDLDGERHNHAPEHHHSTEHGPVHRHTWWGGHVADVASHSHDGYEHSHGDAHEHSHPHSHEPQENRIHAGISLKSLFALGVTGGIVPCPAALVVLLGALALHRVAFGLFLIVAFSAGLAAVLIGFGLVMVYARRFVGRFGAPGPMTERWLPLASSAVITVVGFTITLQSLAAAGVLRAG